MHLLLCVSLKLNNVYLYIQKTWEVPGGPGSWVGKSKLSPHSGSVALRQLNPLINMSCKVFFKSKSFKLNMTDWPCYAWLQKELVWPTNKVVTYFYAPIWKIGLCVLYHQTKMLTLRKNGIYQQWTRYSLKSKSVLKMHFPGIWRSKFTDLANKTVKKTQSLW